MNWWQRFEKSSAHTQANIVCTVLVMFATIGYALIAWRQLSKMNAQLATMNGTYTEMQKQTSAAKEAADAACVAAQISRGALLESIQAGNDAHNSAVAAAYQTLVSTQSEVAKVVPNTGDIQIRLGREIGFLFHLKNQGKSDANNVWARSRSVLVPRVGDPDFKFPKSTALINTPRLAAGEEPSSLTVNPWVYVKNNDGTNRITTDSDLADLDSGKKDLLFYSRITYDDTLGVSHWEQFCRVAFTVPPGQPVAHDKCIDYNKTDHNTIVPKPAETLPQLGTIPEIKCPAPPS